MAVNQQIIDSLQAEALGFYHAGYLSEAEEKYQEIIQLNSSNADALRGLGMVYFDIGKYQEAWEMLHQSLAFDSTNAESHYNLGLVLEKIGYLDQAITAYQKAIELSPEWIEVYHNLGKILSEIGSFVTAEAIYQQAIDLDESNYLSHLNLGNLLMICQRIDEAIKSYQTAWQLNPSDLATLNNLGIAFVAKDESAQASFYFGYAAYYQAEYDLAISHFKNFLATQKGEVEVYLCLSLALQETGQTESAIELVTEALKIFPNEISLQLENLRILPILYDNQQQIEFYRQRFTQGWQKLIQQTDLENPESRKSALQAISSRTNFYLQYQAYNDLELQKFYGEFVHQVMAANYPQWVKKLASLPLKKDEKTRIGYVSDCFHWHSVGMVFLGWIKHCQKQNFEIYCYYTNNQIDEITEEFQEYCHYFHHIPNNLEAVCQQIITDKLHILVFLDIGMAPQMTQLAALRLAPIQCAAWGHPVTTGLPTIDYFISGDLMEPKNAVEHYSEQLICLPNIGIFYSNPNNSEVTTTRLDFQLREDAIIYLSCQSLFKYLPQSDYIFPTIAQQVPNSQFVFIAHSTNQITEQFRQRIQLAFTKFELNSEDYCLILPRQSQQNYRQINQLADIFLDTIGFTGFLTTLESITCNLPVVTCAGDFMRSRQSYGILKMLGITDTIAQNETEYIQIAVKLGLQPKWRKSIVEKLKQQQSSLYEDKTCITALENFYQNLTHNNFN